MFNLFKKSLVISIVLFMAFSATAKTGYAEGVKVGYIDIRRAFYEYKERKTLEDALSEWKEKKESEFKKDFEVLTKMTDEATLMSGDAKAKKEQQIQTKRSELKTKEEDIRRELLAKNNDMFRKVLDDIQKAAEEIGKKEKYDYVFDSRNIMYADEKNDLTDKVLKKINK